MEKQDQAKNKKHQQALDLLAENHFSITDSDHPDYLRARYDALITKNIKQTQNYVPYDERTPGEQLLRSDVLSQLGISHYMDDHCTQKNLEAIINMSYYVEQKIQTASYNSKELYGNIKVTDLLVANKRRKNRKKGHGKQERKNLSHEKRIDAIAKKKK